MYVFDFADGIPEGWTPDGTGQPRTIAGAWPAFGQPEPYESYLALGEITHNQQQGLSVEVVSDQEWQISFLWGARSEAAYDWLRFSVDGSVQDQISGNSPWQPLAWQIPAGTRVLRWYYVKDQSVSELEDEGYVTGIQIPTTVDVPGAPLLAELPPRRQRRSLTTDDIPEWAGVPDYSRLVVVDGELTWLAQEE